jgi:hypothetical protein
MPARKRLVVDASVARSAGEPPVWDFVSAQCRAVLETILAVRHQIAFSAEGLDEWNRHRSRFARRWQVQMTSRKLVVFLGDIRDEALRGRLEPCCVAEKDWQILEKDCHLVEAALQTDRIVLSRDETVRQLLRQACGAVAELREILWANPEIEEERVTAWIAGGARRDKARRLAPP